MVYDKKILFARICVLEREQEKGERRVCVCVCVCVCVLTPKYKGLKILKGEIDKRVDVIWK